MFKYIYIHKFNNLLLHNDNLYFNMISKYISFSNSSHTFSSYHIYARTKATISFSYIADFKSKDSIIHFQKWIKILSNINRTYHSNTQAWIHNAEECKTLSCVASPQSNNVGGQLVFYKDVGTERMISLGKNKCSWQCFPVIGDV